MIGIDSMHLHRHFEYTMALYRMLPAQLIPFLLCPFPNLSYDYIIYSKYIPRNN
jgi:hypothetical protein